MDTSPTLATIRTEAAAFPAGPFLLTVGAENRPHCIPTTVDWAGGSILVRAPSRWEESAALGHGDVTLLWPSPRSGDYSLIVDGRAAAVAEQLSITPTRAVLHRSGTAPDGSPASCGSDCRPIWPA